MSRFSRINTIWRKELVDTLRDRRTLIAMVLVPMVLYPALMLGSMQALEVQVSSLQTEQYDLAVPDESTSAWLHRLIDSDAARHEAAQSSFDAAQLNEQHPPTTQHVGETESNPGRRGAMQGAKSGAHENPPKYRILIYADIVDAITRGKAHAGVAVNGPPPGPDADGSVPVVIAYDEAQIRSEIAAAGVRGVLERARDFMLARRLARQQLDATFVEPLNIQQRNVANAERMAGSVLGQIVPLILIMMTITGAIYPAIDLTAGERERGTLETLMAAPVPTVDLIAGKFVVVTFIGMLSAILNLLSIGGTIYLGGVGSILTQGAKLILPVHVLPLVLAMLLPLAVMFSAILLAVCSFARSFKEAQNYVVPVIMAAMIPGVVGILPGTRLEGPIVIMPVANVVVLTRELFLGEFDVGNILWVTLSTSLYAVAAIAVAAKLFGQEAVLFVDSGSVKTIFQRRHFKPRDTASAATALLALTIAYTLNFYIQNSIAQAFASPGEPHATNFVGAVMLTLVLILGVAPYAAAVYLRLRPTTTFQLSPPKPQAWIAGLLFGCSTWVLARAWFAWQQTWFKMDPGMEQAMQQQQAFMFAVPLPLLLTAFALTPAICEELFFRGFVLSGLRGGVGPAAAAIVVALAFGLYHYSAHRMAVTTALGLLLCVLAMQYRSIWPGVLAHLMHNGISVLSAREEGFKTWLAGLGLTDEAVPPAWLMGAAGCTLLALMICAVAPDRQVNRIARRREGPPPLTSGVALGGKAGE